MFGPQELDKQNNYVPDLKNIEESAKRTFGEANSFFRKELLYLDDVSDRLFCEELINKEDIYDECHAIAADLAKCCEMYLKAIYIYEHNVSGVQIEDLWEKLKSKDFQTDTYGNRIYETASGIITFAKTDPNGNVLLDSNGREIYTDNNGNLYSENSRGKKIPRDGHYLDRLIELLSPESRLLLETRMLTIPMNTTESNRTVSIFDLLQKKGLVDTDLKITVDQYKGWIDQHRRAFEDARYSGEKKTDVSIEFLYHLATQLKAVAQYVISPKSNQIFNVTDQELAKLPQEVKQLASFHSQLLSEQLIKLIINDETLKNKFIKLLSGATLPPLNSVSPDEFYNMFTLMSADEIAYTAYLSWMIKNFNRLDVEKYSKKESEKSFVLAQLFNEKQIESSKIVNFCIELKNSLKDKIVIGSPAFYDLFSSAVSEMENNKYTLKK